LSRFTRYIILLPFTVITNTLIADRWSPVADQQATSWPVCAS
jgi:hypothetical protein